MSEEAAELEVAAAAALPQPTFPPHRMYPHLFFLNRRTYALKFAKY
jgi:hypothetical protein